MRINGTVLLLCILATGTACTHANVGNGKINVAVEKSVMHVLYGADTLYRNIPVGLTTTEHDMSDGLTLSKVSRKSRVTHNYDMITGKRSHCHNSGVSRTYTFSTNDGHRFDLTVQVYPDGVAFRYSTELAGEESVTAEKTTYQIDNGTKRWMQQYVADYEGFFPLATDGRSTGFRNRGKWGYPALVEHNGNCFSLITEANMVRGNAGSQLVNSENESMYRVTYASAMKPQVGDRWESPWRIIMIGSLSTIVESTLVTDVSEPAKYDAKEWVQPGKVSWNYWANNHGSKDYQIIKAYIDLAAQMGWPYSLVDWEWNEMANGGNIDTALAYAREHGVKLLLWYNSSTSWLGESAPGPLYKLNDSQDRKNEYKWLAQKGFKGVKIDFFPDDAANTMNYYMDLLEDAAAEQIMVNLHGATVPRGWQRTYPNLMTVEAVYGAEWYNNNRTLTPRAAAHNATLPFTRNVVGPMDYTPGTFSDSQNPHVTTYAHELALPILFESALLHMPDRPEIYLGMESRVRELLSILPTVWDETKLIGGYPGEQAVLGRRKDKVWYVAGVNGKEEEQTLPLDLSKLSSLGKEMTLFTDGNSDRDLQASTLKTKDAPATLTLRPRGGFVAVIK